MVVAETLAQALDAAEAVDGRLRGAARRLSFRGRDAAGRAGGLGRGPRQHPGRHLLRRPRRRPNKAFANADHVVAMDFHIDRVTGVPMEPRAALGAVRRRDRPLHAACRQRRRGAAEARARRRPRHRRRTSCGCCPTTSAAISARATASSSSSGWCCGPRASSAVRSSSRRRGRKPFSATTRAATSSPRSSWRSHATAASSPCARPISAMSARAACRSRRSPRARA